MLTLTECEALANRFGPDARLRRLFSPDEMSRLRFLRWLWNQREESDR